MYIPSFRRPERLQYHLILDVTEIKCSIIRDLDEILLNEPYVLLENLFIVWFFNKIDEVGLLNLETVPLLEKIDKPHRDAIGSLNPVYDYMVFNYTKVIPTVFRAAVPDCAHVVDKDFHIFYDAKNIQLDTTLNAVRNFNQRPSR